jgi:hypothetical protein
LSDEPLSALNIVAEFKTAIPELGPSVEAAAETWGGGGWRDWESDGLPGQYFSMDFAHTFMTVFEAGDRSTLERLAAFIERMATTSDSTINGWLEFGVMDEIVATRTSAEREQIRNLFGPAGAAFLASVESAGKWNQRRLR